MNDSSASGRPAPTSGRQPQHEVDALLGQLRDGRGLHIDGARADLVAWLTDRKKEIRLDPTADYSDYIQVHPDEFGPLLDAVLSGTGGFFADPDIWQALGERLLAPLILGAEAPAAVRVWDAGCGAGQEAYTIAMVLAGLLGEGEFGHRVKIYATDVSEAALAHGRHAVYTAEEIDAVPAPLRETYVEPAEAGFAIRGELRRSIVFGRHDLTRDAAISRVTLIVCRNTLAYLNAEAQYQVMARFHNALDDGGLLMIGPSEVPAGLAELFGAVNRVRGVYRKLGNGGRRAVAGFPALPAHLTGIDQLCTEAFVTGPVAQLVITSDGLVALINQAAENLLSVSSRDIGRPFSDLEMLDRSAELRQAVQLARFERRPSTVGSIDAVQPNGETQRLEAEVQPLTDQYGELLGVTLLVHDVTDMWRLYDSLNKANRQLESAYEELQSTNEELETTNEELQSTVEELETTNEELQSTNEELETMNEELQSTNDELQNTNDQLQENSVEVDSANEFLEAVLTSIRAGVVVVNPDLAVQVWNRRAEDLWGLRRDEAVGQHFLNLDIGLRTDTLRPLIRGALGTDGKHAEIDLPATNRRGRGILLRVTVIPLGDDQQPPGVVLVMEELRLDHGGL